MLNYLCLMVRNLKNIPLNGNFGEVMKKINVLYDATVVCNILKNNSARSGIFFVAYNVLLEFLKRDEFNIFLYADDGGKLEYIIKNYSEFSDCKIYKYSLFQDLCNYVFYKKIDSKLNKKHFFAKLFWHILTFFLKFLDKIQKKYFVKVKDIDVYFSPMKAVPKFVLNNKQIKKYIILHDAIPLINDYRQNANHEWYFDLIKSINCHDIYFANSISTKQDFIEYVPKINSENIIVIPLSTGKEYVKIGDIDYINQVKSKYGIPLDKKYIFSLCNLDPRKNLIFSIKNFLRFVEKNNLDNFIFVLGGACWKDFENILNENIENLGEKKDKILKIGYVDDEDMSALYSGAEMFLYPSLYEGFGIPVLEAMKCGLPVICSNTTSLPEVIGDCGIKINPYSDAEMLAAMEKMYFDRDFREECITKGIDRSKMFTWKKCVDVIQNKIIGDIWGAK